MWMCLCWGYGWYCTNKISAQQELVLEHNKWFAGHLLDGCLRSHSGGYTTILYLQSMGTLSGYRCFLTQTHFWSKGEFTQVSPGWNDGNDEDGLLQYMQMNRQPGLKSRMWSLISDGGHYLLDFVLDGQFDSAQAGSVVGARWTLVHIAVQDGLHFLCVPAKVQHTHHKILALHRQFPVVILQQCVAQP